MAVSAAHENRLSEMELARQQNATSESEPVPLPICHHELAAPSCWSQLGTRDVGLNHRLFWACGRATRRDTGPSVILAGGWSRGRSSRPLFVDA